MQSRDDFQQLRDEIKRHLCFVLFFALLFHRFLVRPLGSNEYFTVSLYRRRLNAILMRLIGKFKIVVASTTCLPIELLL